jgi:hypothetical protein
MAVVKANYVKRGAGERGRAKATVRYIQHRRGENEQTITRTLFGREGELDRKDAYRIIDEAPKGSIFYRLILSPDPKREDRNHDLDMRDIATQTINALEDLIGREEPIEWIAATHADHAPHLHTHIIAVVPKRLYHADLAFLRHRATKASLEQRRILDLARYRERERPYPIQRYARSSSNFYAFQKHRIERYIGSTRGFTKPSPSRATGSIMSYPKPQLHTCFCTRCFATHIHSLRDPVHKCKSCGLMLHRQQQLRILRPVREHSRERQAVWQR